MKSVNLLHLKGFLYKLYKTKWIGQLSNICLKIKWNKRLFMRICEYKLVKLQLDKQQKLLKIVPKQEIRLLKMRKRLEMIKSHMRYVYEMSQEHLIKKKRMQLSQKQIVNIIARFLQQEISIRKL